MKSFVAFCENKDCGAMFEAQNIIGGSGNATIHMTNTRVGPCPNCGSMGIVPDGIYSYANEAISFLTGPNLSIQVLKQVNNILKQAKVENLPKNEILNKVKEVSPKTAEVLENAPSTENYFQWIGILIALIALAIQIHTSYFKGDDIEKEFREYLLMENKELKEEVNKKKPNQRTQPKPQRNKPCPCGSGNKYKKCCGRPIKV